MKFTLSMHILDVNRHQRIRKFTFTDRKRPGLGAPWLVGLATIVGYASWGHSLPALAMAPLLAWLWALADKRWLAGAIVFAYYLAAMRDLPVSVFVFFGDDAPWGAGYALWLVAGVLLALPWAAVWPARSTGYSWRIPLALLLVTIPPLGIFGTANPLTAAGFLFPDLSWLGLLLALTLMVAYGQAAKHGGHRWWIIFACHVALVFHGLGYNQPETSWQGVETSFGRLDRPGVNVYQRAYAVHNDLISRFDAAPEGATLLFPENVIGLWNSAAADLWSRFLRQAGVSNGKKALISGIQKHADGSYESVLVAVGPNIEVVHAQRVPVPISMWRPFSSQGARSHWWESGIFEFGGLRVAAFVCYEQLLVWPVLLSFAGQPQILVAPSNVWWANGSSIPVIEEVAMRSWARLFGVPLVMAFNR